MNKQPEDLEHEAHEPDDEAELLPDYELGEAPEWEDARE